MIKKYPSQRGGGEPKSRLRIYVVQCRFGDITYLDKDDL